jgi:hypothetical protein
MTYNELITYIEEKIYSNETNDVTGDILQTVLKAVTEFANSRQLDPDDVIKVVDGEVAVAEPLVFYVGEVPAIKLFMDGTNFKMQAYDPDTETYKSMYEFEGGNLKNFPFPLNRFYSAIELDDVPLTITVDAGDTEKITNGTETAFVNTVEDGIFLFADDKITMQNLPSGFKAWVKVCGAVCFQDTAGPTAGAFEVLINNKGFQSQVNGTNSPITIPIQAIFEVNNTDTFELSIKNNAVGFNATCVFSRVFADFELIKLIPPVI